jgi:hypothetical protein
VPAEDVIAKFRALSTPVLGELRARRVLEAIHEIDTRNDIRDLTASLVPA